jgi:predicted nucleic acid-binding protein
VALYLDTSCLLKILFPEPESATVAATVAAIVATESRVVVSTLARLEARVRIAGRVAGGLLRRPMALKLARHMETILSADPFEVVRLPPGIAEIAEKQVVFNKTAVHCRSLDRLHLAVMQSVPLNRILTTDTAQAKAARALGFAVVQP